MFVLVLLTDNVDKRKLFQPINFLLF